MALAIDTEGLPAALVGRPSPDADSRYALVNAEIAALATLDLSAMRLRWRNETGRTAPAHIPKFLLLRMLAYRIQANVFGDLDPGIVRTLNRIARQQKRADAQGQRRETEQRARQRVLKPGTMLVREWNGELQRVTVLNDGFAWNGKTYASLSTVAKTITGTAWSGPRFFGLLGRKVRTAGVPASTPLENSV